MVLSYSQQPASNDELEKWNTCKSVNPRTNRKIKPTGLIFKTLKKQYLAYQKKNIKLKTKNNDSSPPPAKKIKVNNDQPTNKVDKYIKYRKKQIDPILLDKLPLHPKWKNCIFKFEYQWDPFTGIRKEKDKHGPLCFDPDTLIYFFYSNRLRHLWQTRNPLDNQQFQNQQFQETYGDALGQFPDFNIPGRGKHPDWYLFRLPIMDAYLPSDHCHQVVTMGPILTNEEINEIQTLAQKQGNNYFNTFGKERPDLRLIKKYYDQAVSPLPQLNIDDEIIPFLQENESEYLKQLRYNANITAVEKLRFY